MKQFLDKRCKTNILKTLGNKYLAECIKSKDNTKDVIEILGKYFECNWNQWTNFVRGLPNCFADLTNYKWL